MKSDAFDNERKQLIDLKNLSSVYGEANVKHTKKYAYGRSYAKNGLLMTRRQIRSVLCSGGKTIQEQGHTDYDMKNAHYSILQGVMKLNEIDTPEIDKYIKNRDKLINRYARKYPSENGVQDHAGAKELFIKAMYGGKWTHEKEEPESFTRLSKECARLAKKIVKRNPDIVKQAQDKVINKSDDMPDDVYNLNGKVLSYFLQEVEHNVLDCMYCYFVSEGIIKDNRCSLQADGIMIPKGNTNIHFKQILTKLNKYIVKHIGFKVEIVMKPFIENITMDKIMEHQIVVSKPKVLEIPEVEYSKYLTHQMC